MTTTLRRLGLLCLMLMPLLAACSSMSPKECSVADWQQVGYGDAARGHDTTRLDDHRKSCAEAGISPDMAAYLSGHDEGLDQYCTRQTGFRFGSNGNTAPSQCGDRMRFAGFQDGYENGQLRYTLSRRANQVAEDLAQAEQIITDLSQRVAELTDEIDNAPLTDDERRVKESQRNSFRTLLAEEELDRKAIEDELRELQDRAAAITQ